VLARFQGALTLSAFEFFSELALRKSPRTASCAGRSISAAF
jgi:hypothetical protein